MRTPKLFGASLLVLMAVSVAAAEKISMLDDCDAKDPEWASVGGCLLRHGEVTFAEFVAELDSPLASAVVGHQSWRNEPSFVAIDEGHTIRVENRGGRPHTFTQVAEFGGGKVPPPAGTGLNEGLVTAPECPGSVDIPPGGRTKIENLGVGTHRFQCCIHPWMRAHIKVEPK
jgi:plastocyanin